MTFFDCVFGPRLYMDYGDHRQGLYKRTGLEKFGDQIISTVRILYNFGYYTSPLIAPFLYRRGFLVSDYAQTLLKFGASVGIIVAISLFLRGVGRFQSHSYLKFIKSLSIAKEKKSSDEIVVFDFDFRDWTIDFDINLYKNDTSLVRSTKLNFYDPSGLKNPCKVIAYIAINTFGIRMIYPGSLKVLQNYMRPLLILGRAKLINDFNARRYKIRTVDKNDIDTIFVDNRNKEGNGQTLVICSEGNAGFYEIGIMTTPLSQNYSVLGWNHPGFEGSTGIPFPDQEKNAIDCVMKFAINRLGFAENDILLFGWSIGGYTTLLAASSYPAVKGVILDATFDDILYLAQSRMPRSLSAIVEIAIRSYCNLNNWEHISNVMAPVMLIRRTSDEIIAEDNCLASNRGNFLAIHLLTYRYPYIFKDIQLKKIQSILSKTIEPTNISGSKSNFIINKLKTLNFGPDFSFPLLIGEDFSEDLRTEMAEFLLYKHVLDYNSSHCTSLPAEYFYVPWDITSQHL